MSWKSPLSIELLYKIEISCRCTYLNGCYVCGHESCQSILVLKDTFREPSLGGQTDYESSEYL